MLPLRICRTRITLVGILRIALLLRDRLPAAGHARRRPRRSPEQGLERIEELRRRGNDADCGPGRDRRGNEAGNAKQSGHRAKSLIGHARGTSLINTENTAARGPLRAQDSVCSLPLTPSPTLPRKRGRKQTEFSARADSARADAALAIGVPGPVVAGRLGPTPLRQ